ncbi:uncharacterized protein DEA37_0000539 [Paragonimus westermani]|uniref:Transposase domain-containing protein n=1 Tax=Paragonimus westermani TaxID=34504 RepID=A0A5J4NNX2_9TREM|nr:uncharacterized protein DEA37_0000539 [Paragonimus westermani]
MVALEVAFEANLSLRATNIMLRKFKELLPELPMDARTLLGTPRVCMKKTIDGGEYVHFGVKESIEQALRGRWDGQLTCVHMQLHIDGVTLFKSSRRQLWPILARLTIPKTPVFVIGIFCGEGKPGNVCEYLADLVGDLKTVLSDGVTLTAYSVHVKVVLNCIIGDAPARAFFRQVKNHTGYYACEKCTARGVYVDRRMAYPNLQSRLRNDADFRCRKQAEHHIGDSPFESLNIDMIACFPLDYMHMVCLGFTKKIIALLRFGPLKSSTRIGSNGIKAVNTRIGLILSQLTSEFPRKCRTFHDCERWKAREFRQFLLYIGPVALKGLVDTKVTKPGYTLWPGVSGKQHNRLLLEGAPARQGSKLYKVKLHRITDDFENACRYESVLEQLSDIPSTDATLFMNRQRKRKIVPTMMSDFTDDIDSVLGNKHYFVDIDYSSSPPPLDDMSGGPPSRGRIPLSSVENVPAASNPIATR